MAMSADRNPNNFENIERLFLFLIFLLVVFIVHLAGPGTAGANPRRRPRPCPPKRTWRRAR
ncbi:MAG: hypothetical protein AAB328_10320, partial [candidate division NC10 bacterium]